MGQAVSRWRNIPAGWKLERLVEKFPPEYTVNGFLGFKCFFDGRNDDWNVARRVSDSDFSLADSHGVELFNFNHSSQSENNIWRE